MSAIKVTIHSVGTGTCSLTGKDSTEGLTVSFEDATVNQLFLSWRSFRQLLAVKSSQVAKAKTAVPANGPTS